MRKSASDALPIAGLPCRVTFEAEITVPMFANGLCAGFPSPADDFLDEAIDLNRMLIRNQPATFLWRVDGHSMRDAGIYHGDILVVDRSLRPCNDDIVVAIIDGTQSLKRLRLNAGRPRLQFENTDMPLFEVPEIAEVEIWGVATFNLHRLRKTGKAA